MSNNKFNLLLARPLISSLVFTLLIGVFSTVAFGQREFGQLTVKVTDQNDAVIAGASVKAKSVSTGAEKTATSDNDGIATFSLLLPGEYEVEAVSGSFTPFKQKVQVNVGSTTSVDAKLGVTAGTSTVDITSGGLTEINTQDQQVSNVVTRQQLENLPTINRNPYAFVALAGNATDDAGGATGLRGAGFALNGQRAASTNITLDGGDNVDSFTTLVGQAVPLDSVQEFRVTTSNFSAEYGRASGGIVNVSTRSGANGFFGTAFWFHRNGSLAANDFDRNAKGQARPFSLRNQFGYSFGGPIVKDKLLFFSNTEWTRVRSYGSTTALIPTPELLAASAPATRNFFNQYQLDPSVTFGRTLPVSEVRAAVNGAFPTLADGLPAFREAIYTAPTNIGNGNPGNDTQTLNRIDWNISDRAQLYYRLAIQANTFQDGVNSSSPWKGFNTGIKNTNQNHLVNFAYTINPNLVSNTKFVYNRLKNFQPLGEQPVGPTLYVRSALTTNLGSGAFAFPGYLPFTPGAAIPFGGPQDIAQILQDISWMRGKHNFKFGAQFFYLRNNRTFGAFQNAVFGLSVNNTAQGLNNLVAGNIQRLQVAVNPQGQLTPGAPVQLPVEAPSFTRDNRAKDFAWYVNDNWRITPRLTLNLGLRWEYYGVQKSVDPSIESNFYYGSGTTLEERIRNGGPKLVKDSAIGQLWRPDWNNYAPRVGFAWDIFGNGKTSLRGGYGIAYERNFGNVTFNVIQNPPAYAVVTVNAGAAPFVTIPIPTTNFGPLAGNSGTVNLPGRLNIRHVDENIRTAYSHFWSVSFEREIVPRLNVAVDYSASAGRKLYDLTNPNRPGYGLRLGDNSDPFGTGAVSSLLNPQYYPLNTRGNRGKSDYQGITFSLLGNNFANTGLTFSAKYTYSQAKDNLSSTFSDSVANNNLGLLDPFNPDLDYALADFDVKHRFVTGFTWDIPFARSTKGFAKQALDGWSISSFFNANSGTPITLYDCTNQAFEVCPRINPVGGDVVVNRNLTDIGANTFSYITLTNRGAVLGNFINPQTGTSEVGPFPSTMLPRNSHRNLGTWFFDLSAIKTFSLTERYKLQFRSEFYNILNHANATVNFGTLDLSASPQVQVQKQPFNNAAGVPFVGSPRRVQFALRFMF